MKKFWKGLATVAFCTVLNFGLTTNVQATELDSMYSTESEYQEMRGTPPPIGYGQHRPHDYDQPQRHKHRVPPPPPDYYNDYPPPPPHHGHRQPPPPLHRW